MIVRGYYDADAKTDPVASNTWSNGVHILRGGSFPDWAYKARVAQRCYGEANCNDNG